jgi:hydroxyacylglutathione hydrolase
MIRDGIPTDEVEPYLHARAWLADAARLLGRTPEVLAAEHTPVATGSLRVSFPRAWPPAAPTRAGAAEPQ